MCSRSRPLLVAVVECESSRQQQQPQVALTKLRVYKSNKKDEEEINNNENYLSAHDLYQELLEKAWCEPGKNHGGLDNDHDDAPRSSLSALPSMEQVQIYDTSLQQYISLAQCCRGPSEQDDDIIQRFGRRVRIRILACKETTTTTTSNNHTTTTPANVLAIAGRYYEFDGSLAIAGHDIFIQQDSNRCHAGTAINVWDGSILMARYLEYASMTARAAPSSGKRYSDSVNGRVVLELGAGCGLTGLAAGVLGARVVILTDLATELERLQRNVTYNQAHWSAETTVMTCQACDWYNPPELTELLSPVAVSLPSRDRAVAESTVDLILVADCVWMEDLVEPLFSTLRRYTTGETRVLITYQRRGKATDRAFWSALRELFGSVQELHPPGLYKPDVFHLLSCQRQGSMVPV